jgi:hypothetical protein
VTVTPPNITTIQQNSTSCLQLAQQQSLGITTFQQISPRREIWFGTRGSEVQILSPRPILSNNLRQRRTLKCRPTWFWPRCSSVGTSVNTARHASEAMQRRLQNRLQCCVGKTRCPTRSLNCRVIGTYKCDFCRRSRMDRNGKSLRCVPARPGVEAIFAIEEPEALSEGWDAKTVTQVGAFIRPLGTDTSDGAGTKNRSGCSSVVLARLSTIEFSNSTQPLIETAYAGFSCGGGR